MASRCSLRSRSIASSTLVSSLSVCAAPSSSAGCFGMPACSWTAASATIAASACPGPSASSSSESISDGSTLARVRAVSKEIFLQCPAAEAFMRRCKINAAVCSPRALLLQNCRRCTASSLSGSLSACRNVAQAAATRQSVVPASSIALSTALPRDASLSKRRHMQVENSTARASVPSRAASCTSTQTSCAASPRVRIPPTRTDYTPDDKPSTCLCIVSLRLLGDRRHPRLTRQFTKTMMRD